VTHRWFYCNGIRIRIGIRTLHGDSPAGII
jgi:hypothetical protein